MIKGTAEHWREGRKKNDKKLPRETERAKEKDRTVSNSASNTL